MESRRNWIITTLSFVWELAKIIIISLAIIIPIRFFLVQPFFVRGASMEPGFEDGQYLIIDELSYRFSEPQRGEVVVFRYPQDPSQYYIKRIIGLPKEKIEIEDNKILIYNDEFPHGLVLDESEYLGQDGITNGTLEISLDENEYFVLGDNRAHSSDSRRWGPLPRKYVVGRAWIRAWPFNQATIFSR